MNGIMVTLSIAVVVVLFPSVFAMGGCALIVMMIIIHPSTVAPVSVMDDVELLRWMVILVAVLPRAVRVLVLSTKIILVSCFWDCPQIGGCVIIVRAMVVNYVPLVIAFPKMEKNLFVKQMLVCCRPSILIQNTSMALNLTQRCLL